LGKFVLTNYFYENILLSMIIYGNTVLERKDLAFIYSCLDSISGKSLKYLRNIAQSLVLIQNRPGTPIPDSISQEIVLDSMNELLREQ